MPKTAFPAINLTTWGRLQKASQSLEAFIFKENKHDVLLACEMHNVASALPVTNEPTPNA